MLISVSALFTYAALIVYQKPKRNFLLRNGNHSFLIILSLKHHILSFRNTVTNPDADWRFRERCRASLDSGFASQRALVCPSQPGRGRDTEVWRLLCSLKSSRKGSVIILCHLSGVKALKKLPIAFPVITH